MVFKHAVDYVTKSYINSRILCYYTERVNKPKPLLLLPPPMVLDYILVLFRSNEGDNSSLFCAVCISFYRIHVVRYIIPSFYVVIISLNSPVPNPCIFNLFNKSDEYGFCIFKCGEIG